MNVAFPGCDAQLLLMSLDLMGYAVSTGSACSAGTPEPSAVLLAMGLSEREAGASLRISVGPRNTVSEVDAFLGIIAQVVERVRGDAGVSP